MLSQMHLRAGRTPVVAQRAPPRPAAVSRLSCTPLATIKSRRCGSLRCTPSDDAPTSDLKTWYALVANAEFFLNDVQQESMAEQLREKTRFYKEQDKETDFFLVSEPPWLDDLPGKEKVRRPAVALVSADKMWTKFMKLRLDRVLEVEIGEMTTEDATRCGAPPPEFEQPKEWTAPYSKYADGWYKAFMPGCPE